VGSIITTAGSTTIELNSIQNIEEVGGVPGGANTEIQYNKGGDLDGIDAFRWDETNHKLLYEAKSNTQKWFKMEGVIEPITGDNTLLWFSQPDNAAGNGAGIRFDGGDAQASGKGGGGFEFFCGAGAEYGGGFSSYAGDSSEGDGGWNYFLAGDGAVDGGWNWLQAGEGDEGGWIWIEAGQTTTTDSFSGSVYIQGGNAPSGGGNGGDIQLETGTGDDTSGNGNVAGSLWLAIGRPKDGAENGMLRTIYRGTLGDFYVAKSGGIITTTDATTTSITASARGIAVSNPAIIEARVIGRRTGGTSGSSGDSAMYIVRGAYKNVGGTVSLIGSLDNQFTAEDQSGWDCTLEISSTEVQIKVTGAANNNIEWNWEMTAYIPG
jgi:hypothetical protein